jgi:hypothetical protein
MSWIDSSIEVLAQLGVGVDRDPDVAAGQRAAARPRPRGRRVGQVAEQAGSTSPTTITAIRSGRYQSR